MKKLSVIILLCFLFPIVSTWAGLPEDIVFYMPFDDGSGDEVSDLSGNGNNGTVEGNADWVAGKYDGALYFDGSTHVTVENSAPLKSLTHPMTASAWVNPDTLGGWRNIVEMDGSTGWKMGFNNQTIVWTTYNVKDFTGQTPIETETWTHVAATWDGSEAIIYINGEPEDPIAGGGVIDVEGEPSLDIGFRRSSNASFFEGSMDDLWISNTVKSQDEIQELMGGFAGLLAVDANDKLSTTWGKVKELY